MESIEKQPKWPLPFKVSVGGGVVMVSAEAINLALQVADVVDQAPLGNVAWGVVGVAGIWRIVEPMWLMRKSQN